MKDKILLRMEGISKHFGGVKALADVNLTVREGEVHALMGENGAGKSTLMKILGGAYILDKGEIYIDEQPVKIDNPLSAQELGIAVIYQEQSLVNHMSVADNIFLGRIPHNKGWVKQAELLKNASRVMRDVGVDFDPKMDVSELSVAQRQFVEIAKALSMDARIIVMDEPSAVLTLHEMKILFDLINVLRKQGRSIIYISHRLEEIFEITDRCTVLKDGKYVRTIDTSEATHDKLIKMMTGRELQDIYPAKCQKVGPEALSVSEFTRHGAFQNVTLKVHEGEVIGVAGLVGSGRTDVAQAIFGLAAIDGGEMTLSGQKKTFESPNEAIRGGVVYIPEDRKENGLILDFPIGANMTLSILPKLSSIGVLQLKQEKNVIAGFMEKFRVKARNIEQWIGELSGGNQQKVMLARGILLDTKVIIVDEPTRGVDVGTKVEIYKIIRELADSGKAIIMISSELPEIIGMSDRIYVMHQGKITGCLDGKDATEESILFYATGGSVIGKEASYSR